MNHSKNGHNLNYVTQGEGVPIILVHGLAASLHDWEALMPELVSYGYKPYAVDLFGHGKSPKPNQPDLYTITTLYHSLESWIESLEIETAFVFVGHSLGGLLTLKYVLQHPERVRSMVLIDPLFCPNQLSPLLRLLKRRPKLGIRALEAVPLKFIDALLGWDPINIAQFSPQARWQIAYDYKRASPYILNITRTIPDLRAELKRIQTPSLILWGNKDLTLNPASFPELVDGMANASGHLIPECGHQPHIGKPVLVNRVILDYLNSNLTDLNPDTHRQIDASLALR